MRTALLEAGRTPLTLVDDVETVEPGPGQVLVRIHHCGICHSDLTMIDTDSPAGLPVVLLDASGEILGRGGGKGGARATRGEDEGECGPAKSH